MTDRSRDAVHDVAVLLCARPAAPWRRLAGRHGRAALAAAAVAQAELRGEPHDDVPRAVARLAGDRGLLADAVAAVTRSGAVEPVAAPGWWPLRRVAARPAELDWIVAHPDPAVLLALAAARIGGPVGLPPAPDHPLRSTLRAGVLRYLRRRATEDWVATSGAVGG
jgi:hypothetical protein